MSETLKPGAVTLEQWQRVYRGACATLDPGCFPAVERSAAAIERVVNKGAPVYGVNTGFGKLASVRIEIADLERLQRNIVLSHSAGVGDPMPTAIVRLMMALKLASLGVGASGVRLPTLQLLEAMLARDLLPVVPTLADPATPPALAAELRASYGRTVATATAERPLGVAAAPVP